MKKKFKSERERIIKTSPDYSQYKSFLDDIHKVTESMSKDGTFETSMIYSIQDQILSALETNQLTDDEKAYYINYSIWGYMKILMETFEGSELINDGSWILKIPATNTLYNTVSLPDLLAYVYKREPLVNHYNKIVTELNSCFNPFSLN